MVGSGDEMILGRGGKKDECEGPGRVDEGSVRGAIEVVIRDQGSG